MRRIVEWLNESPFLSGLLLGLALFGLGVLFEHLV